jgi:haloacetate dehalogenase
MDRGTARMTFDGFVDHRIQTGDTEIFVSIGGVGPPVLLLHGFPQTHLMWRHVAPVLAADCTIVCADLRGYGQSGCPPSTADHAPYAKRAMAIDMVRVMEILGFSRFSIAAHDRGGRVAYRLALDHPDRVDRLAVLDILPTETTWARADDRLVLNYWPWSLLAQAGSLPEHVLMASAAAVVDHALREWGSPASATAPEVRAAYIDVLRDPAHAHAIAEEYRAAAAIDREHDRADLSAGRRLRCPVLVLWGRGGPLDTWYEADGGPVALWQQWAEDVRGLALDGGHFFPEARPGDTATALGTFFARKHTARAHGA